MSVSLHTTPSPDLTVDDLKTCVVVSVHGNGHDVAIFFRSQTEIRKWIDALLKADEILGAPPEPPLVEVDGEGGTVEWAKTEPLEEEEAEALPSAESHGVDEAWDKHDRTVEESRVAPAPFLALPTRGTVTPLSAEVGWTTSDLDSPYAIYERTGSHYARVAGTGTFPTVFSAGEARDKMNSLGVPRDLWVFSAMCADTFVGTPPFGEA